MAREELMQAAQGVDVLEALIPSRLQVPLVVAFGVDGTVKGKSPDRADALVWAITELLLSDGAMPSVRML
mgnify:CR=1 FL=1